MVERGAVRVPGVLQGAVLEQQAGADGTDIGRCGGVDHEIEPVGVHDLGVVVQQQQEVATGVRRARG
jgi:hypothetical protein